MVFLLCLVSVLCMMSEICYVQGKDMFNPMERHLLNYIQLGPHGTIPVELITGSPLRKG